MRIKGAVFHTHMSETSIGEGAFGYDFGALENTDNKLTRSYRNLAYGLLAFNTRIVLTIIFDSFGAFGGPSKEWLFMMNAFKWAPKGSAAWILDRDQRPGMVNLRENKIYVHEVAAKLIEEKRQELKDGISRKDLLSLLGSSCIMKVSI